MDETSKAIGHLQAEVQNLKTAVLAMAKDVTAIRKTLDEARGGSLMFLWMASASSGIIGAAIVRFWSVVAPH